MEENQERKSKKYRQSDGGGEDSAFNTLTGAAIIRGGVLEGKKNLGWGGSQGGAGIGNKISND